MPSQAKVCAWIAACGLVMPALASAQDRSEREIVGVIVREGPQGRAIRAAAEVVRLEQLVRVAYPNPAVTYSREGAGLTEFLQVEQRVPAFGSRSALSRAGVAAAAAAEGERDGRLWTLRADAGMAAARAAAAQAHLDAAQTHTRDVQRVVDILRSREREGEGSRFDRLRAEQELRDTRLIVTAAAVGLGEARASLAAMLPSDVRVPRITPTVNPAQRPASAEGLSTRAIAARAEVRALERSAERARLESEAARRARLPAPTVFGGLKRVGEGSGSERGGVFGVSLSLPLFDAGAREAARWTAERGRVEAERAAAESEILTEVARASDALVLRQTALEEDAEGSGDELARVAEVAYREGEVGILELLDAVRIAFRARVRSIDLELDARLAQIALERAVGEVLWP